MDYIYIYVERERIYVLLHFRYERCRNVTWDKIALMRILLSIFFSSWFYLNAFNRPTGKIHLDVLSN
jgi:hypothetical protein